MTREEAVNRYINEYCVLVPPSVSDYVMATDYKPMSLHWVRTKEAMWLLDKRLYYSAAMLTFTFPEICGRIENNDFKSKDKDIYRKWYDENITKYFPDDAFSDISSAICMNGYLAYKLRCQLVHCREQGLTDIPNGEQSKWMEHYRHVTFRLTDQEYSIRRDNNTSQTVIIYVGFPQIARQLIRVADAVYTQYISICPDKFKTDLDTWHFENIPEIGE